MKIEFERIDHVQICIPIGKEEEARAFYTNIIGLTEIPKPQQLLANGGLWYQVAGTQLHIGTEASTLKSKSHPAFQVKNLNATRSFLETAGVQINNEVQIEGMTRFSFKDPFGNRIEFLEYHQQ